MITSPASEIWGTGSPSRRAPAGPRRGPTDPARCLTRGRPARVRHLRGAGRVRAEADPRTHRGRAQGRTGPRSQGREEVRAVESPGAAGPGRDGAPPHVGVRTVPRTRHQASDALPVRRPAGPAARAGPRRSSPPESEDRDARHRPHRPGDAQRPAAGKARRLDEQHVAALAGCGQAQGDAGTAGPGGDLLVAEPRRPEPHGHPFRPHPSPGSGRPSARRRAALRQSLSMPSSRTCTPGSRE